MGSFARLRRAQDDDLYRRRVCVPDCRA